MRVPIGTNGWYICNDQDQPDDDYVEFRGHEAAAIQFLNQFRSDPWALRTFKGLLGAVHPLYDDDSVFDEMAVRIGRRIWLVRQPTFRLFPSGGTPITGAAAAFPMEDRQASTPSSGPPVSDPPVFPSDIDPGAIAQVMQDAAASGVPFCEECARAAAQAK